MKSRMDSVKPIVKWVGGKRLIIHDLFQKFPKKMETYHELFLGGGSVLIALLQSQRAGDIAVNRICAYDSNDTLIHMYKNIQQSPTVLYEHIKNLQTTFTNIPFTGPVHRKPSSYEEGLTSRESFYYWMRQKFNTMSNTEKNSIDGSVLFIFLNKTCFRGLYRVGPNGFNVPYGNYKNIEIVNAENLMAFSELIRNVTFSCMDFRESIKHVSNQDFVYLDPPYVPISESSFVKYTHDGFKKEDHECLFELIKNVSTKGIKFLMSNSDGSMVITAFSYKPFTIETIECRRAINSKKPDSTAKEVLVYN